MGGRSPGSRFSADHDPPPGVGLSQGLPSSGLPATQPVSPRPPPCSTCQLLSLSGRPGAVRGNSAPAHSAAARRQQPATAHAPPRHMRFCLPKPRAPLRGSSSSAQNNHESTARPTISLLLFHLHCRSSLHHSSSLLSFLSPPPDTRLVLHRFALRFADAIDRPSFLLSPIRLKKAGLLGLVFSLLVPPRTLPRPLPVLGTLAQQHPIDSFVRSTTTIRANSTPLRPEVPSLLPA
ncbi:hypothetical protein VTN96DRAFT_2133 [Rasamsonia emersonii]